MWYKNIAGRFFGLVTKHACDRQTDGQTDRRTDKQNYDSQDRASIAASHGKNYSSCGHRFTTCLTTRPKKLSFWPYVQKRYIASYAQRG